MYSHNPDDEEDGKNGGKLGETEHGGANELIAWDSKVGVNGVILWLVRPFIFQFDAVDELYEKMTSLSAVLLTATIKTGVCWLAQGAECLSLNERCIQQYSNLLAG